MLAAAALQAVEFVGLPECQLTLAQAVTYLAAAPKSNAATLAIGKAREDVRSGRTLAVPKHLRDAHYQGAEQLGHGEGYQYSHDYPGGWVGSGVPAGGAALLRADGPRLRGGDSQAAGSAAATAATRRAAVALSRRG